METTTMKKKFKCEICEKSFSTNPSKNQHVAIAHGGKVKTFSCNVCNKIFRKESLLSSHVKIHHEGKRNHKCDSCGKSFTQAGDLKRHMLTHEGQRNYKCDYCGKSFTRSGNLKRHIKAIHE